MESSPECATAARAEVISVLVDTTYVDNAVDALVAALDHCRPDGVHGEALVVSNGEPRPIAEVLGAWAEAGGAPRPSRHLPVPLALAEVGWMIEELRVSLWAQRLGTPRPVSETRVRKALDAL